MNHGIPSRKLWDGESVAGRVHDCRQFFKLLEGSGIEKQFQVECMICRQFSITLMALDDLYSQSDANHSY